jgi:hypothetical protein
VCLMPWERVVQPISTTLFHTLYFLRCELAATAADERSRVPVATDLVDDKGNANAGHKAEGGK